MGSDFLLERLGPRIDRDNVDQVRRAKLVLLFVVALVACVPLLTPVYYLLGSVVGAVTIAAGGPAAAGILALFRRTGSLALAGNSIAFVLFAMALVVASVTGGFQSPALLWVVTFPMVSFCISGGRAGFAWAVTAVLTVGAFYAAERQGVVFRQDLSPENLGFLFASLLPTMVVVVTALVWSYEHHRVWAFNTLDRRNRELELLKERLVETSRRAGMAEVATGVIHNVGNVLNGVTVSAGLVREAAAGSEARLLGRVAGLVREHEGELGRFVTEDPKGQALPGVLEQLAAASERSWQRVRENVDILCRHVDQINAIVAAQQKYASGGAVLEPCDLHELCDDALQIAATTLERHRVVVARDYNGAPPVETDKHQVISILVNLIQNAARAAEGGRVAVRVTHDAGAVRIAVEDNGAGIAAENLERIFQHGFTTHADGHGFGLHSAANTARSLGGELSGESDGVGCGATFRLELPIAAGEPGP